MGIMLSCTAVLAGYIVWSGLTGAYSMKLVQFAPYITEFNGVTIFYKIYIHLSSSL